MSAGVLAATTRRLGPTRVLDAGTYYGPGTLVCVVRRADPPGQAERIAIDPESPDHILLTHAAYPLEQGYRYVEHPFPDVPAAIARHHVDAGIWHRTPSPVPLDLAGLGCPPLPAAALAVWKDICAAALVSSPSRPELRAVLDAMYPRIERGTVHDTAEVSALSEYFDHPGG